MVFKEAVAMLLGKHGTYTCSDDIEAEKKLYDSFVEGSNGVHDWFRQRHPGYTDAQVSDYITKTESYGTVKTIEECLKSHGVDVSQLPQAVVPEFGDVASLALRIGMGAAVMGGIYAANRFKGKLNYKF